MNFSLLSPSHTTWLGSKEEQSSGESLKLPCALGAVFRGFPNFGLFRGEQCSFKWHWYNALLYCVYSFHKPCIAHRYPRGTGFPYQTSCTSLWSGRKVSFQC